MIGCEPDLASTDFPATGTQALALRDTSVGTLRSNACDGCAVFDAPRLFLEKPSKHIFTEQTKNEK